jgi:hypothetical protein
MMKITSTYPHFHVKKNILVDCFSVLKEINESNRELKLLCSKDLMEDQPMVVAAKSVGTMTSCHKSYKNMKKS